MKAKILSEVSAAISILAASATGAFAQAAYSVTDLGHINASYALSINNIGQVAVNQSAISILSPYLPLGKYINDSGQMLQGSSLLYGGGTVTTIAGIDGTGINNSGQIVGTLQEIEAGEGDGFNHAVIYNGFTITDFGHGSAIAINDSGEVVGFNSELRNIANQAFDFSSGQTLAPYQSWATAINNNGQVVGCYDTATSGGGFLYSGGTLTYLGFFPNAINDSGQIVGGSYIYSNGTMTDLNSLIPTDSGWTLTNAEGINNSGQIVGYDTNPLGQTDAFLLTPTPEPSTVALGVAGAAMMLLSRRFFRQPTTP
jgi:probable HAF family extracellular repeat protein